MKDGFDANLLNDRSASRSSNIKEQDSVSETESSDLEYVRKESDGLKSCPPLQTGPNQSKQGSDDINQKFAGDKVIITPSKQLTNIDNKFAQRSTPASGRPAADGQPRLNL